MLSFTGTNIQAARFRALLFSGMLAGCASQTTYQDPDRAQGARGWGAFEIKQTTRSMVGDLHSFLAAKKEPIVIAFKPIRNRTSEHIETEMLANQMKASLVERKIYFVELSMRGEILKEIAVGQTGLVDDSAIPIGNLKSPNYFLEGVITDATNFENGRTVQFIVVTLTLVQARSGVTEWTRNKEFLKSTNEPQAGW